MGVDLTGAIDLHCHFGPDAHRQRSVNAIEAVVEARASGHAGVVLKSHDQPTTLLAWALDQQLDGVRVFGGICCDREVGGVNPAAVEVALRTGARVVWLPTLSSVADQRNGVAAQLGIPGPGIGVIDGDGALTEDTRAVLELVQEHDAVLATGHITAEEHVAVVREFCRPPARRGTHGGAGARARLVVTHAGEELAGPNLTVAQCVELADMGATIELCAMTCIGPLASRAPSELAAYARAVGPERCTLGTDYGQKVNVHPAEGLQLWADTLVGEGLRPAEVRHMACTNPAELLGLQ